jgi:hypothetical protein
MQKDLQAIFASFSQLNTYRTLDRASTIYFPFSYMPAVYPVLFIPGAFPRFPSTRHCILNAKQHPHGLSTFELWYAMNDIVWILIVSELGTQLRGDHLSYDSSNGGAVEVSEEPIALT